MSSTTFDAPIQNSTAITVNGLTRGARLRRALLPYLLVLPTFLFIATFTLWPTVSAAINSTIKPGVTVKIAPRFVGLDNFRDLFDSTTQIGQSFPRVLENTLLFVAVTVPVSMFLAFFMALGLNRKLRAIGLFRFAFFYPVLMPMIGAASIFAFIYADNIGLANVVSRSFGLPTHAWIGDAFWTPIAIMIVALWKQSGFYMIIYLAALQSLPTDVYEAADLDGASAWVKLRRITWPLISSTTIFVLITAATNAFQMVDQLYALGQGVPDDKSNLLLYFIFQKYNERANGGYVNAITVIMLILLACFTVFNFAVLDRRAYYES
jgi:sn-glycerol 3-phosphate transport system permease protein